MKKMKLLLISLGIISSIAFVGCAKSTDVSTTSDSKTSVADNKTTDTNVVTINNNQNYSPFQVGKITIGKYKLMDIHIKTMNDGESNYVQKMVLSCSYLNPSNNEIKSFVSDAGDKYNIHINYLKDNTESYMEVSSNRIDLYINTKLAEKLLT